MGSRKMKPYSDRTDLEKLEACWGKFNGFMDREEWSAAITRAATATEIATNIAIRHELQEQRSLEAKFVDNLLIWANGIVGKLAKILRPLYSLTGEHSKTLKLLEKKSQKINDRRNEIVHSGNYMNQTEAEEIKLLAKDFIEGLVGIYHKDFKLKTYTPKVS